jgi:hypothetical protein
MNSQMTVETALSQTIRRFSTPALAKSFLQGTRYQNVNPVIMGDDGKFWVCSTPRQAYTLIAAGYEEA